MRKKYSEGLFKDAHISSDKFENRWMRAALVGITASTMLTSSVVERPALADPPQAVVGMPFAGKWAYNVDVSPPYTDVNSSHPSVHNPYGFQWATDLYPIGSQEVKVYGSSPGGAVTFRRNTISDTCSSYGTNVAGRGVTFDVLVNGAKTGEVKYDHLDLVDVGSNPIVSGTKIGDVTNEALHASCFQNRHTHIQFKNTAGNASCYIDHGRPGVTLTEGANLGIIGSTNNGVRQACASLPSSNTLPGADTIGVYNPGISTFDLRNSNTTGSHDITLQFGNIGAKPLVGDWNNDGFDTIGVYNPGLATFDLRNSNTTGSHDITLAYGNVGSVPLVGDWNGDGIDTIGVYNPSLATFDLRNSNTTGSHDITLQYGNVGAKPIVGDWNGN